MKSSINEQTTRRAQELARGTFVCVGYVMVCQDTGNMALVCNELDGTKPIERLLVVCEQEELMRPTLPCFQTGMEKVAKKMREMRNLTGGNNSAGFTIVDTPATTKEERLDATITKPVSLDEGERKLKEQFELVHGSKPIEDISEK